MVNFLFKFLFGTKPGAEAVKETTRQTAERALEELNGVLAMLPEQPRVTVAPRMIDIDWPEQMPGEAKALPAPSDEGAQATEEARVADKAA